MENANRGHLLSLVPDKIRLESLGDAPEIVFVFGALFQSPLKELAHSVCRKLVVSFRLVSNDRLVSKVSYSRKGHRATDAGRGYHQASCSRLHEELLAIEP